MFLGVDVGGSKIASALVDSLGRKHDYRVIPTGADKGRAFVLDRIVEVIKGYDLQKGVVGLSLPGTIHKGRVLFGGGTLSFLEGLNIRSLIARRTGLRVVVENDANSFALAEALLGVGKRSRVVLGVVWGTGVGAGLVVDGDLFRGSFGGAGELGHLVVSSRRTVCSCGKSGCLESLIGGPRLIARYKRLSAYKGSDVVQRLFSFRDPVARRVLKESLFFLGKALSFAVDIVNPDLIVLGGRISDLPSWAFDELFSVIKSFSLRSHSSSLRLVKNSLGPDAGVIGAGLLASRSLRK